MLERPLEDKKFFIKSFHDVYEDNWEKGEGKQLDYYEQSAVVKAETKDKAIAKFYADILHYTYNGDYMQDTVIVDKDNVELNGEELEEWKDGNPGYSNSFKLKIWCCEPC